MGARLATRAQFRESMRKGDVKGHSRRRPAGAAAGQARQLRAYWRSRASPGPGGSGQAEATYENGGHEFTLKVIDLAAFGAMTQFGNAFRIEKNRQDEDGFEHVPNKDGTFVAEKWDNDDEEGSYTTIVDKRFLDRGRGRGR